jgi:hypothetical protein
MAALIALPMSGAITSINGANTEPIPAIFALLRFVANDPSNVPEHPGNAHTCLKLQKTK